MLNASTRLANRATQAERSDAGADAGARYAERLTALRAEEAVLERDHRRLGYVRLAFGLAVLLFLLPPGWLALAPVLGFALAAHEHGKVLQRLAAVRRSIAYYGRALARVEDRWSDLPSAPAPKSAETSLYSADLDLFGAGSLFTLLDETRTSLGRDTLATWLLAPASVAEIRLRQSAVQELRSCFELREAFAAAPGPSRAEIDATSLGAWATADSDRLPAALFWSAPLLVALTLLAAWRFAVVHSPLLLVAMLVINGGLSFRYAQRVKKITADAERGRKALRTVGALLARSEVLSFETDLLRRLQGMLRADAPSAARALQQLERLAQWAEARSNYFVRILNTPFLYSLQLGLALDRWRSRFGRHLPGWLHALGELEALLSLAAYAAEHPDDAMPELVEAAPDQALYEAEGLGHPLLSRTACVRNDVHLGPATRLLLVSGSNMSGKSTLLRSVGINAVLAFAGAPVRARSLRLSQLALAASIRTHDSLQEGQSRFYAEILRLRSITETARLGSPLLFLADELLAGTNSSDRLEGARGLTSEWLRSGALGLLSTHDLALTNLATELGPTVCNVHFQDDVQGGQLRFDYTLRPGPVTRSNGLALMRLIGLDV